MYGVPSCSEHACKPNFVSARGQTAIIHLGRPLPDGSSDLPGRIAGGFPSDRGRAPTLNASLFDLAPRGVYLAADVTTDAGELLPHPFTHHLLRGWFTLCCTCRRTISRTPGRYPARCPLVFGLSSFALAKATARHAPKQGSTSITKIVEQTKALNKILK